MHLMYNSLSASTVFCHIHGQYIVRVGYRVGHTGISLTGIVPQSALSDLFLIDTVAQHWHLAVDRDRIAVGLSFECPPDLLRIVTPKGIM